MKHVDMMRQALDHAIRHTPRSESDLYSMARWSGMAEMIALIAGTERADEYDAANQRVKADP